MVGKKSCKQGETHAYMGIFGYKFMVWASIKH